jgi:xanthine dehydrogenase YagR molybdenum-binding subunit
VPPIELHFLDYPDTEINAVGAKGIREIGLAAAITVAVRHATGVRVRELPVKIEHLLAAPPGLFRPV